MNLSKPNSMLLDLPEAQYPTLLAVPDKQVYHVIKRVIDVTAALLLLLALLPLLIVIAVSIPLDSPGSFLFVQERTGSKRVWRGGRYVWEIRPFNIYKFRSMARDVDPTLHQAHIRDYIAGKQDESADVATRLKGELRVTRVGRIIRKTSFDELPQLLNVLKGDMSLVGPRPVPTYEAAEYPPAYLERLCALPGITGLWQVMGRCETTFEEQIALDIEYVRNQSLWLDFKILLRTIPAVISGRGAE